MGYKKNKEIIQQEFVTERTKHHWEIGQNPFDEFRTQIVATMAFPTLFPDGKGDPTNQFTIRSISDSDTDSFAQELKHSMKFAENINGKWVYRFAAHPRFGYWACNT